MTLTRRILAEKRRLILPIAVLLLANIVIYGAAVYPMSVRVAAAERRADAAARTVRAAEENHAAAQAMLVGKNRADAQLEKFYREVLPADQAGARRITYLRLAQLAEQANLRYERRSSRPEQERDSRLARLRTTMVLGGEYRNVRQFIYELETAPEFVVIEDVALAQGEEQNAPLVLTLEVSTYYRTGGDGI